MKQALFVELLFFLLTRLCIQQLSCMFKLFIRFKHFILAFDLSLSQLLYNLNIAICKLFKWNRPIMILIQICNDLICQSSSFLLEKPIFLDEVNHYFFCVDCSIAIAVQNGKDTSQVIFLLLVKPLFIFKFISRLLMFLLIFHFLQLLLGLFLLHIFEILGDELALFGVLHGLFRPWVDVVAAGC